MRVTISDELAEALQAQLNGRTTLDQEAERRLQETLHAPGSRVVLSLDQLEEIAERIGTGLPIRNLGDLDRALGQVAQLKLGNERLVFTPSQLLLIEERAHKAGETTERFVGMIAAKIVSDIFMIAPGSQGVFYTPGFDPDDETPDNDPADAELEVAEDPE